ncbi:MAG: amidohydrolase family protein [Clostridia bacterium]|nr:amidohydrolase family protein [Clostridia bacterium]
MKYALINMNILDGHENMQVTPGKAIIVENEKILDIIPASQLDSDIEKIDLKGSYIIPGLINLHVHIPSAGKAPKNAKSIDYEKIAKLLKLGLARAIVKSMCKNYAKQDLYSGTTTIRAVGGVLDFDTWLRDKINSKQAVGPRILASNYAVSVPGGHMTGSVALPVHSEEEAVKMVEDLHKTGVDQIKLMITGGVLDAEVPGEPGILKMPASFVKAACDKAHELGYMVAAHVESTEGMIVALENGVDTVEHGGKPSDEAVRLFKEKKAVLVATLSPAAPFAYMKEPLPGMSEMYLQNGRALFEHMKECVNTCLAEGITVGLGTDTGCPYTTHYDFWRELLTFSRLCNVTPNFALHTATETNAKIAGISDITGTIDVGKSADFVVVKDNPLEDLEALRNPEKVIFRGDIIENPKVKRFKDVDEALDMVMKAMKEKSTI